MEIKLEHTVAHQHGKNSFFGSSNTINSHIVESNGEQNYFLS